ncbi:hypothetical protein Q8F55_002973 [Vanrija albida]|uniref:Uncharacterized protein n=1 Tax=Vanrija albida TaxID=181172 RepID=A0ABR3QC88_9TREE
MTPRPALARTPLLALLGAAPRRAALPTHLQLPRTTPHRPASHAAGTVLAYQSLVTRIVVETAPKKYHRPEAHAAKITMTPFVTRPAGPAYAAPLATLRPTKMLAYTPAGDQSARHTPMEYPLPEGVAKVVLNLRFDPARSWMAYLANFRLPSTVEELVLLFSLDGAAPRRERDAAEWQWDLVRALTSGMAAHLRTVRYTLVDAELGAAGEASVCESIRREVWRWCSEAYECQDLPTRAARMREGGAAGPDTAEERSAHEAAFAPWNNLAFLSSEEYCSRVGPEQFALEIQEK